MHFVLSDFDHYVTVLMGESSHESSSDYDDSDIKAEKGQMKKQRKKKRLMYGVEDIKNVPLYNTKYVRCKQLSFYTCKTIDIVM